MKIGLVTLYDFNYGSALQCYASQRFFASRGHECKLLMGFGHSGMEPHVEKFFDLARACACRPWWTKRIARLVKSQSASSIALSDKSISALHAFVASEIDSLKCSSGKPLNEYCFDAFFSGSDQIWNGFEPARCNERFLRFVPSDKRVAWAPSFGSGDIAPYNVKRYTRYISDFAFLSAREESGSRLIEKLVGRSADVLPDPVTLLKASQWRSLCRARSDKMLCEKVKDKILLFFINEPSEAALSSLKTLARKEKKEFVSFGYEHKRYKELGAFGHIEGSPWDFLSCLSNSKLVITDSFHAAVFSLLFHQNFYVCSREYGHSQNQSERIVSLLGRSKCLERLDCELLDCEARIDFKEADRQFELGRTKAERYLAKVCEFYASQEKEGIFVEAIGEGCSGCGACLSACPRGAIGMVSEADGFVYPKIEKDDCISCGRCLSVCPARSKSASKDKPPKSYIGFCSDTDLVSSSSSGGIFPALAREMLDEGGVVFGAKIFHKENGDIGCKHIGISTEEELSELQGSKYIQSSSAESFPLVKRLLESSQKVLYCGTSCQIHGLLSYLGENNENLVTVDLVCHGVPSAKMFNSYVSFLGLSPESIESVSFRKRISEGGPYRIALSCAEQERPLELSLRESAYYRLFMNCVCYRPACYSCKYSNVYKPADITLGDYYASPTLLESCGFEVDARALYSCVLTHSEKGERTLLKAKSLALKEVAYERAALDHPQLQSPSLIDGTGLKLKSLYDEGGFQSVQKYIDRRNSLTNIAKKAVGIMLGREKTG